MTGVVLLCAEDDDLELVSWVHNARKHGITPEVVIGVERDDEPLIEALASAGPTLFVVLRSENLGLQRMHELKSVFARHHQPGQELVALRLQPEEAEDAIVKIASKLGRDVRPRSGSFPVVPLSERSGATPRRLLDDSTLVDAGTEPTGVFAIPAEIVAAPMAEAPPVPAALDWARRATELEVTEPSPRVDPQPSFAATGDGLRTGKRVGRPTGVVALATVTAVVMLCALVGGILWLSAAEWTSAVDGSQRSTVVAPGSASTDAAPPTEARIPTMERSEDETEAAKPRPRAKRRSDSELAPLEVLEPPAPAQAPTLQPPSPVANAEPLRAEADRVPPPATTTASASAEPQPATADEASPPATAGTVTRPPA